MQCPVCKANVEIPNEFHGKPIGCPSCHQRIVASPFGAPQPPVIPQTLQPAGRPAIQRSERSLLAVFCSVGLFGMGSLLVLLGFSVEADAKSAMHQIHAAIQYCTGFVLIGMAAIMFRLSKL